MSPPADAAAIHDRRWAVLWVMNLSLVIVVAGNSALNVALPSIVRELDATSPSCSGSSTPTPWSSPACCCRWAPSATASAARAPSSAGSASSSSASFLAAFATERRAGDRHPRGHGRRRRHRHAGHPRSSPTCPPPGADEAIAIWAGFAGAGGALGPLASGLLLDHFWWGSVFLVNVPIALWPSGSAPAGAVVPRYPSTGALDPVAALLSMVALAGLLYGVIEGPENGSTEPRWAFIVGVASPGGVRPLGTSHYGPDAR